MAMAMPLLSLSVSTALLRPHYISPHFPSSTLIETPTTFSCGGGPARCHSSSSTRRSSSKEGVVLTSSSSSAPPPPTVPLPLNDELILSSKGILVEETTTVEEEEPERNGGGETVLYSIAPLPLMFLAAALPGAGAVRSLFGPFVDIVKSIDLPGWLVHWGHPGNMAVVLFAMGGYGTYLGFRIRYSDDVEEKANAKDLHPKLLAGMFFFFALGATGGVTALLTSDKPIFESPHAVTGFIGLSLLTIQTVLPTLFEGNPGLRNVHGILGSGIMTLFLIHAALGLQLGLSF